MSPSNTAARTPPPLPPRQQSTRSINEPAEEASSLYEAVVPGPVGKEPMSHADPRSSSQQSLVPSESNQQNNRRRLLLVYIHGFMGNEMSFRSFPAHVHNLLTALLADTHVVHTKIYPRYRSRRNISFARDDFSRWLEPHEDAKTDVVLLGHSMGGLLAAEVATMPSGSPERQPLKHRILGTINFDVPFLGMHPGIIKSGLASIFTTSEETHEDKYSPAIRPVDNDTDAGPSTAELPVAPPNRADTLWTPGNSDPNYNPSFNNDVILPVRKGWRNAWHFVSKHSGDLRNATKALMSSHMEFGGAMANYNELKLRYARIRSLEEQNDDVRKSVIGGSQTPPRIRFINYYTASTGKPKRPKPLHKPDEKGNVAGLSSSTLDLALDVQHSAYSSRSPCPSIALEENPTAGPVIKGSSGLPSAEDACEDGDWGSAAETSTIQETEPVDESQSLQNSSAALSITSIKSDALSLPPVPDTPDAPPPLDSSYIQDPDTRKLVEKEHARAVKAYEQAVKDRKKAIHERAKLEEKKGKAARKEAERAARSAEKAAKEAARTQRKAELEKSNVACKRREQHAGRELTHEEKEGLRLQQEKERMEAESGRMRSELDPMLSHKFEIARSIPNTQLGEIDDYAPTPPELSPPSPLASDPATSVPEPSQVEGKTPESKKDRRFCVLPPNDSKGQVDPCWVRVFMENVDEVGAHCGLFFVDERYERLVGEVAVRIERWVLDDLGERKAEMGRGPGGVELY